MTSWGQGGSVLDGVRVLDLSPDRVGAQVTQTLADYGAEVVWVEPPGGARLRARPAYPFFGRGKRSVVADLRRADDVERVRSLAASADVLVESFRPGVLDRRGLGYEALSAANPGLIYASITGFGRQGPWAHLKGYEGVVAAVLGLYGGFAGITGGGRPVFVTVPWCAHAASHAALQGILAALLERGTSERGQWVEVNLAQALTIHEGASSSWYSYLVSQRWPEAYPAAPTVDTNGVPMHHFVYRLLIGQTKDGWWLQFAQNRPHLFEAFMHALGLGWMLTDPAWKGIPVLDDEERRVELLRRMLAAVQERTLEEWQRVFEENHNIYAELYRAGPEVLEHPQLVHDGSVVELVDPERGPVLQPGAQFHLSATPAVAPSPAPTLGDGAGVVWQERPERPRSAAAPRRAPLEGVTVMELAVQYAAPYGVTLLADLGARVIKVEQLEGDSIRRQKPQFPEVGAGKVLQGKESVAVDIHTEEGRAIVHRLAGRVDVVVNGFRAGAAERGGFDAATLRRFNPRLLYVNAAGYGVEGPCADRASFAPSFSAAAGIAAAHLGRSTSQDPPMSIEEVTNRLLVLRAASATAYASADGIGALGVATAVLLGLLARERTGEGQQVVSSMLLSTAHAMVDDVVAYAGRPEGLTPGPDMQGPTALYRLYQSKDGWIFLAAPQEREWDALARALAGYVDLRGDPRFATAAARRSNDEALAAVLARVFGSREGREWEAELTGCDVACVVALTAPAETVLTSDEYGRASGYLVDVVHPIFDEHARLAPIVRFSRSTTTARPAGLCGDATDAVLAELGYSGEEIERLRARNVVG